MKKIAVVILSSIALLFALGIVAIVETGCVTSPTGQTTVDQAKLNDVKAALDPVLSSVLRRVIANSPQHSTEISGYARAVGRAFLQIQTSRTFSPADVIKVVNDLTTGLQAGLPPEVIDAKNAAIALYRVLWNDKLTTTVPDNGWLDAVCDVFEEVINQALIDAGQPGLTN